MAQPNLRGDPAAIGQAIEQAIALVRQGRLAEADKICDRLLRIHPNLFDALHIKGVIQLQSGKAGAALRLLEAALKINPTSPEAMSNLGMTLSALSRHVEGLAMIDKALEVAPRAVETLNNRGNVLLKLKRPADALSAFEQALAIEPRYVGARLNRGTALAELGRFEEALAIYDGALAAMPRHAETHVNRGNALSSLGRSAEAVAAFERALAIRPDYVGALVGRGGALQALNRHREAIADFDRAAALDKSNADARHNAGLARLTLGDYLRGFEDYEWRWRRTGMPPPRSLGRPLWLGEYPLARKTILLHAEQGLGDCIQFVRYAPLLARGGAKIVLEVPAALTKLLARVEGVTTVVARGEALPAFDVHCPLASLPRALRTEPSSIPAGTPYLAPRAERIAAWRARIDPLPIPRIAIAWAGNAAHPNDLNRSIALNQLAPLLAKKASFVSVQRDLRAADAEALAGVPSLIDVSGELADFGDTAAVLALVDLVITVDTSVAHLAGALGRPTWIIVPFSPDWRWMLDREDSPWYPTARLFRQSAPGDWTSVVARVREALTTFSTQTFGPTLASDPPLS
jgi:tetratricopeptide (TPR) repeat protein